MARGAGIVTRQIEENVSEILANTVLMVRPAAFGFNPETAGSNAFQKPLPDLTSGEIQELALAEFDNFALKLRRAGVNVVVFDDLPEPKTPDAIFPNNWFCTMPTGEMFTFPMESRVRRFERQNDILSTLTETYGYELNQKLEAFEGENKALEGTGSLILDHDSKLAYAAISSRTDKDALLSFEAASGYLVVPFRAFGPDGAAIYHTNVMMALGPDFVLIGTGTLANEDRNNVLGVLERSGKTILELSNKQIFENFAGNMLCLAGKGGQRLLVMSKAAEKSLTNAQRDRIMGDFNCQIVSSAIPTIERLGGGSARCMLAEVF